MTAQEIQEIIKQSKILLSENFELASAEIVKERQKICAECDKKVILFSIAFCAECGCHIKTKTQYNRHILQDGNVVKCPLGKW